MNLSLNQSWSRSGGIESRFDAGESCWVLVLSYKHSNLWGLGNWLWRIKEPGGLIIQG